MLIYKKLSKICGDKYNYRVNNYIFNKLKSKYLYKLNKLYINNYI
jgi:hypothetical protein